MVKIWDLWGLSGVWFCGAGADLIWRGVIFERKSTVLEGGLGWGWEGFCFLRGSSISIRVGGDVSALGGDASFGEVCFISIKILSFLRTLFIWVGSFNFGVRCFYFEGDAILGGCF